MTPGASVGLIGLGRMGEAIAHRLLKTGRSLIVWNRTSSKGDALAKEGVFIARAPHEVVEQTPVTLVIVRDDAAVGEIYGGAGGLLAGKLAGRTIVDLSTTTIAAKVEVGRRVTALGGRFVDAPVSGTVGPAREGRLVVMAGAEPEALATAMPVLEALAHRVVHTGPVGTGMAAKLALNLPLAVYWQALGEALALGQAYGLEACEVLSMIADSKAAVGALAGKLPIIRGEDDRVEFDLSGMAKDLTAMIVAASAAGLRVPAATAARDSAAEAVAAGWGDRDLAALVRFVGQTDATAAVDAPTTIASRKDDR